MVKCPSCGKQYMASQGCSNCASQPKTTRRPKKSGSESSTKVGPIITFVAVFIGLVITAETVLSNNGFLPAIFVLVGGVMVMWVWKVGYWFDDGESIFAHLAFQSLANEFLGFFLSPSKIIWFWTTERPYFRACTIATWLAFLIFWLMHFSMASGNS